jgi:hypothetical protein
MCPCFGDNLMAGEIIRVDGEWFKVFHSYDGSSNSIPVALVTDASVRSQFHGSATATAVPIYRWARGFDWSVTFLSMQQPIAEIMPLYSPIANGLNPVDATVAIRTADCINCMYVNDLVVWNPAFIKIRASNDKGISDEYSSLIAYPKEIPGPPASIVLDAISGDTLAVSFVPPAAVGAGNDAITSYLVQWDLNDSFNTSTPVAASCDTSEYGSCAVTGSAITVVPPFKYFIRNLVIDTRYYVRVAARNIISAQSVDPTGFIPDNTRWAVGYATTANQPPSAPIAVTTMVSGKNNIQVLITPPTNDGGVSISEYLIEWDSSNTFASSSYDFVSVANTRGLLPLLKQDGDYVYEISGLNIGESYWVRVSAKNSIGYSAVTTSMLAATTAGKPNAPASVSISTAIKQTTPISEMAVTWTAPTGIMADGGSPITGYMVEWWEDGAIDEVQVVRFTSPVNPLDATDSFFLAFGPESGNVASTGTIYYNDDPFNVRSMLLNLRQGSDPFLIDELSVTRTPFGSIGYEWTVTFHSEVSSTNQGDQVSIFGKSTSSDPTNTIDVLELVSGSRNGGSPEIQILTITSTGSTNHSHMGGWFRLSFEGSETPTQWLPVNCTSETMVRALEQLDTIRTVEVTKSSNTGASSVNHQWTISFTGNVGKQPAIDIDSSLLFTSATSIAAVVDRGDNRLTAAFDKETAAFPGETPKNYQYTELSADARSFTIPELVPGHKYYARVSAMNSFGNGPVTIPATPFVVPPKQIPQPPVGVSIAVHPGSSTTLDVTYDTPMSDGGADILHYRVELDITPQFTNPIYNIIPCYPASKHTVYEVATSGYVNDPIVEGGFKLKLTVNGNSHTTDLIPYDTTATSEDEVGVTSVVPGILATLATGNNSPDFTTSATAAALLFANDTIKFSTQSDSFDVYKVIRVVGTTVTVDADIVATAWTNVEILRFLGGRTPTAKTACNNAANAAGCLVSQQEGGGSVQSKLHMIRDVFTKGVAVDRDATPTATNGVVWRVTFLDDAIPAPNDYALSAPTADITLRTLKGSKGKVTVTQKVIGQVYSGCTGTHTVPNDKALANGQFYYARVFAVNEVGYSLPQVSPSKQKPMIPPGAPTSVTLSVFSQDGLTVSFNPPASDGGDTITAYRVEYAKKSDFSDAKFEYVTLVDTGAKFSKTIQGLTTGTFYYVRVAATNSQGYGIPTTATPGSLNPHRAPDAPTNVNLRVTSDTMLTVSFAYPENDGGDKVTRYKIEWDTVSSFNSFDAYPHKHSVEVPASTDASYTITLLTTNREYFVRVYAINSAGLGAFRNAEPTSAKPILEVPGRPHTIVAAKGETTGTIVVTWLRPSIPWHRIPCAGFTTTPTACPSALGGGSAMTHGGTPITEYLISYNEQPDFNGFDYGEQTTSGSSLSTVITKLTPGRTYYIRVLARNAQGSGEFCGYSDKNCLTTSTVVSAVARA